MIGVRTAAGGEDTEGPVIRVFASHWIVVVFGLICGGAALGPILLLYFFLLRHEGGLALDRDLSVAVVVLSLLQLAAGLFGVFQAVQELLKPTAAVEVRPDRFTLRKPLGSALYRGPDYEIAVADVTRLWSRGEDERRSVRVSFDRNELHLTLQSGDAVHYVLEHLPLDAVELERLIRETTGLDVPGRPPAAERSSAARWLRAAIEADPDGPVAGPGDRA